MGSQKMNPPIDIKARLAKLRPFAISAEEAAKRDALANIRLKVVQSRTFLPDESHLDGMARINHERCTKYQRS
jgi:hypothetical protein